MSSEREIGEYTTTLNCRAFGGQIYTHRRFVSRVSTLTIARKHWFPRGTLERAVEKV